MDNLIEKIDDFIIDHFTVRCDCHSEFLDFMLFERDKDEQEQFYYLDYHGYSRKLKDNGGFCFTKKTLTEFREKLESLKFRAGYLIIEDANKIDCKERKLLIEREQEDQAFCYYDVNNPKFYYYNILLFRTNKNFKKKKCSWEIILNHETHQKLIERLEIMLIKI